jgi:hypothetical protein
MAEMHRTSATVKNRLRDSVAPSNCAVPYTRRNVNLRLSQYGNELQLRQQCFDSHQQQQVSFAPQSKECFEQKLQRKKNKTLCAMHLTVSPVVFETIIQIRRCANISIFNNIFIRNYWVLGAVCFIQYFKKYKNGSEIGSVLS